MSGLTRETRGRRHGSASEAPTDERVGKRIGVGYNGEIWSLLYYYSARTVQLDDRHVGTVFMNGEGVHFLKVSLDRLAK